MTTGFSCCNFILTPPAVHHECFLPTKIIPQVHLVRRFIGSTVACYWLSSHCVLAQKFVSVSTELISTVCCGCLISTMAVIFPVYSLYELDRHSHQSRRGLGAAGSTICILQTIRCCLYSLDGGIQHELDCFLLRATSLEWKLALKTLKYCALPESQISVK